MSATVVNLQRKVALNTKQISAFTEQLSAAVTEAAGKDFAVAFISDRRMKELNGFFRGKDETTDVLSFPFRAEDIELSSGHGPPITAFLGDIVISAEQAAGQAAENGLTLENEIRQLILHGLLHLCDYDHETDSGEMNRLELELRDKLGI